MESHQKAPESGKEKKTRRRLRLSCVECTKRRQKCDRKYPCSLCTQRGVTHLCRWETVPVARPTPARPPNGPAHPTSEQTIEDLHARIANLEKLLAEKLEDKPPLRAKIEPVAEVISTGETSRFLYAKSTDPTSAHRNGSQEITLSNSLPTRVAELIHNIPPIHETTHLLDVFFAESNWRFGIPEEWFKAACAQMWNVLEYPGPHSFQINANWLSLLFAVLACSPKHPENCQGQEIACDSDHYFSYALMARRIAEDDYLNKPNISLMVSAADGTVLSCLAVPLLCSHLSRQGRVSEAWKLVGNGIRQAQAVGMHRDPEWRQWQVMSKDEMLLRRRAWWGLYIWDKMYSYLMGRPQMLRKEVFDVAAPCSSDSDGKRNIFNLWQSTLIQLCAVAGEALENCFSVAYPEFPAIFDMDSRFEHWERSLPPEYQLPPDEGAVHDFTTAELPIIERQRHTLHTWYLLCRLKLHIAALSGIRQIRPLRTDVLESSKTAIITSMRLIKLQCDTHDSTLGYVTENNDPSFPGSIWFFEGCFSLFEATVTLITTLTRYPWAEKTQEAELLVNRAMEVLTRVSGPVREREVARMAAEVIGTLKQESWWSQTPSTFNSSFHHVSLQTNCSVPLQSTVGYDESFASMTYSNVFGFPA
ncbi:hypothetical protein H0H93_011118 [Arthromyces matolae]|nr:hypothetical protein H0H93_011118 [Arthromyces matolae]